MKIFLLIFLTIGVMLVSGCSKPNNTPSASDTPSSFNQDHSSPGTADLAQNSSTIPSAEIAENSYFFKDNVFEENYKGTFLFNDVAQKDATLHINKIADLTYGKLYELKLDPTQGVPDDRLVLGYFYVQQDKIYKFEPTQENLIQLKSNEFPDISAIVCQDKEITDPLGENEPGLHQYIVANEDRREYHSYNDQVSTGYYESFTWKKDKGLISYRSGFGAEKDSIELQLNNN